MNSAKQPLAWVDHDGTVRPLYQPSRTEVRQKLARWARKSPGEQLQRVRSYLADGNWYWKLHNAGTDRTAYVVGLFGTGRFYLSTLILQHIGERAKYFRHAIRFQPRPTSMIYTGHATLKYASRAQALPAVTHRILDAVRAHAADLIFIYRHPLDSLLTNWVWWRTYLSDQRMISSLSQIYPTTEALCAGLDRHFAEFMAFAAGEPSFFASRPGTPFLSFAEFVEETELFCGAATLSLRLEDFAADPGKEFSKILETMSIHGTGHWQDLARPRAKPYGHVAVTDALPRLRSFIAQMDPETLRRIERIRYEVDATPARPDRISG